MNETSKKFLLLGDSPVLEWGRKDCLKFESTAKVLAGAAVETSYPLTIGIFGEWGTGKTSLMRLIEKEVEGTYKNAAAVWFNAWQYEKEEHLIVPLVATINKELEKRGRPDKGCPQGNCLRLYNQRKDRHSDVFRSGSQSFAKRHD
jgi:Cdc6-like AAA superfamily ATPase